MKNKLFFVTLLIGLISCNTSQKNKETSTLENSNLEKTSLNKDVNQNIELNSKGYELMKRKCYSCHFEKPVPLKREQMIAPPMLRVQEHYKPMYPNKTEFEDAIKVCILFSMPKKND